MSLFSRLFSKDGAAEKPGAPGDLPQQQAGEVRPPWVEYPGIPPWDFFWREAGEGWKTQVWEPYYNSLGKPGQQEYLTRWKVPADWQNSYFDEARRDFWDHVDDPDEEDSPAS